MQNLPVGVMFTGWSGKGAKQGGREGALGTPRTLGDPAWQTVSRVVCRGAAHRRGRKALDGRTGGD